MIGLRVFERVQGQARQGSIVRLPHDFCLRSSRVASTLPCSWYLVNKQYIRGLGVHKDSR